MTEEDISYHDSPAVTNEALNVLFGAAWPEHAARDFQAVLSHNLGHVCAYAGDTLIGFVNIAWDGGVHAFLLDPTVAPGMRHRGIGRELVRRACDLAREAGVRWLHADYAPEHGESYAACGFRETRAGLIDVQERSSQRTSACS
jgi:GNAT superfamily N-acetyltransferase